MDNNFINDIKLMPIKALEIVGYDVSTNIESLSNDRIFVAHVEEESSIKISPITTEHMLKGEITVGYDVSTNIVIPHNDYANNNLLSLLDEVIYNADNKTYKVYIHFGNTFTDVNNIIPQPNANGSLKLYLKDFAMFYNIETIKSRPRMFLSVNAIIGKYDYSNTSNDKLIN